MNNTLIKDFILDCLKMVDDITGDIRGNFGIDLDFNEKLREARNFINFLPTDEETKDEKTELYVKDIMKKFDSIIQQIKE